MTQRPPPPPSRPRQPPPLESFRPSTERPGAPPPQTARKQPMRAAPPPRRRRSWLGVAAWTVGGIVGLVVIAGLLVTLFAPVGFVRDELARSIKQRTGRDLKVAGSTSLSIFPSVAVSMEDVSLSTPPGMGAAPFARIKRLEASAALWPLLSRQIVVDRVTLTDPVFELRVDASGRRSWDFAAVDDMPRVQYAQARPQPPAGAKSDALPPELSDFVKNSSQGAPAGQNVGTARLNELSIGEIVIDNGTVRYRDDKSGATEEVKAINTRVSARSLASPIDAKGTFALRGDRIEFETRLTTLKSMIEQRPAKLALSLTSPKAKARYDGSVQGSQLDGTLRIDSPSVRALVNWIGANVPAGSGYGPLALKTDLKTGPTWVQLSNSDLKLDDTSVTGSLNVDLVGGRPNLKANLKVGALDLNRYLGDGDPPASQRQVPATAPPAPGKGGPAPAVPSGGPSIEDLIKRTEGGKAGPQVKGYTARSGWSEEPLNLAALGILDGEAKVAIASVLYRDMKLGATQLALALKSKALRIVIDDTRLYEGQGRGTISVDAAPREPVVGANLTFDGVSGQPFLKDASGLDLIAGKAKVVVAVGGQGAHERAMMESLAGKAEISMQDGAIVGYDLQQMFRGIRQLQMPSFQKSPNAKTDFSEAAASYVIKGGVAETKDLRIVSQMGRINGTGTIGIGQRQIDKVIRTRVVIDGQGAAPDAGGGLEIPLKIRGSWEDPRITLDQSFLKDPNKAIDAVNEAVKSIGGGKGLPPEINKALRGLFGKQ